MKKKFTIHAFFPNYHDGTKVAYSLDSIMNAMATSYSILKTYTLATTVKRTAEAYVAGLLPTRFLRFTKLLFPSEELACKALCVFNKNKINSGDVAYFWLSNPVDITRQLKQKNVLIVREMINCTIEKRKIELTKAYEVIDSLAHMNMVLESDIQQEKAQLLTADLVFCPNEHVLESVLDYGVPMDKCFKTSYGWDPERFNSFPEPLVKKDDGLTILFAGTIDVRKGAPCLLDAWQRAAVKGKLLLAGRVDSLIRSKYAHVLNRPDVIELGYVEDMEAAYRSADVFCFLSWEEGGPMVTIEAMGCGLACIVTPMGSGGFAQHDENGFVVPPGDVDATVNAMQTLANNPELLEQYKLKSKEMSEKYTWQKVGEARLQAIADMREKTLSA